MEKNSLPQNDHDILIRMDENLRNLRLHVEEITGNTNKKLDDHERRLRGIEKYVWLAIGAISVVQFIVDVSNAVAKK